MASEISASAPVQWVRLNFDPIRSLVDGVAWRTDEDTPYQGFIRLSGGYPDEGTDDYDTLAVLQEIYESDDGFVDADGVAVTPIPRDVPYGVTVAGLEDNNFPNPIVAGSWQRWEKERAMRGSWQQHGDLDEDAGSGLRTLKYGGNIELTETESDQDTVDADLTEWTVTELSASRVRFTLQIRATEEIHEDDLHEYRAVAAFLAWLEGVREGGTAVGEDTMAGIATYGGDRRYQFPQADGDDDISLEYYNSYRFANNLTDAFIVEYRVDFDAESAFEDLNTTQMRDYIAEVTVELDSADFGILPQIIMPNHTLRIKALDFGGNVLLRGVEGGVVLEALDSDGERYSLFVAGNYGRTAEYGNLPDVEGQTYKRVSERGHYDTYHLGSGETANRIIVISNPGNLVLQDHTHMTIAFHNVNPDGYTFEVRDWDLNNLITLSEGEHAKFQITLEGGGNGGKLLGIPGDIPTREIIHERNVTNADNFIEMSGQPTWLRGSSVFRLIPTSGNADFINSDAFEIDTSAPPSGYQGLLSGESDFSFASPIKVLKAGTVEVFYTLMLTMDGNTGSIANGHELVVDRVLAGGNGYDNINNHGETQFQGNTDKGPYTVVGRNKIEADDFIVGGIRYSSSTTSASWSEVKMTRYERRVVLEQRIRKDWSA